MNRSTFARVRGRLAALAVAALMLVLPCVAWAQENTAAPQPSLQKSPAPWIGLAVIFIMLAVVVTISLMPSKRSHQD